MPQIKVVQIIRNSSFEIKTLFLDDKGRVWGSEDGEWKQLDLPEEPGDE